MLSKVVKNIVFQNKTLLVMFYRHNKTFLYQFCNFKHFLKAENSEDSLASSCVEFNIGLSCNPVWDWVTIGTSLDIGLQLVWVMLSHNVPTVTQSHTVAYRTLLVMFCVLKFYFVDFYGMFTSSPTWRLKMHVLCKVEKNNIIQNKTFLL